MLLAFAFIPARYGELGALLPGGVAARFWTPVTYAFLHADCVHLVVNLVWMASFGGALARRFGSVRVSCCSASSRRSPARRCTMPRHPGDEALVIGASGAVSGMMAATARFAFSPGGPLAGGGAPAAYRVPAEPLARRAAQLAARSPSSSSGSPSTSLFGLAGGLVPGASGPIAWEAHIGGFLAGLLAFRCSIRSPRRIAGEPAGILSAACLD